jgi:hypothetical protein
MFTPLQTRIENGCIVGYAPWLDAPVRTPLLRAARKLAAHGHADCGDLTAEHFAMLEGLSPDQVTESTVGALIERDMQVGGLWSKIKKGAKKVGKGLKKGVIKTVQLAHRVTHNKAFEAIHKKIQKMVPAPYDIFVKFHNKLAGPIHKFIEGAGKGDKKRRALAPAIRDAAAGLIDKKRLVALAKKAGVDPDEAEAVASVTRLQNLAKKGDAKAKATISALDMLDKAKAGKPGAAQRLIADAEIRKAFPGAKSFKVRGPRTHRQFHALLIPI